MRRGSRRVAHSVRIGTFCISQATVRLILQFVSMTMLTALDQAIGLWLVQRHGGEVAEGDDASSSRCDILRAEPRVVHAEVTCLLRSEASRLEPPTFDIHGHGPLNRKLLGVLAIGLRLEFSNMEHVVQGVATNLFP